MKRIFIVSGGLLVFAAALVVTLHRPNEPEKPDAPVDRSSKRALSEARAARAELATLRAELGRLDRNGSRSATTTVHPTPKPDPAGPTALQDERPPPIADVDPEQAMEAERNRADEVLENFEDTLDSEPRDAAWADSAEYQIEHALDEFNPGGRAQVVDTKCGSTLCMAELEFADRDSAEELRHHISIGEEFGFTRRTSEAGETPLRQVFVLARPGHALPMPSS